MKCPKCNAIMQVSREPYVTANSNPPSRGRHLYYEHHQFYCEVCDVWTTIEFPQDESEINENT